MESIEQIKTEFKPVKESKILKSRSPENEKINLYESWNVEAAEATAPGNTNNIILTPELITQYLEGLQEIPELTQAIESQTELYCTEYFYYNDLKLISSDINVYLIDNFRRDNFKDSLRLEPEEEFNPLYNSMQGDEFYYFNNVKCNCSGRSVEGEALEFLTWHIINEYANGTDFKTEITSKDILNVLSYQDPAHQELIRQTDYTELFNDITETYNKILKEYIQEAEEAIHTKILR